MQCFKNVKCLLPSLTRPSNMHGWQVNCMRTWSFLLTTKWTKCTEKFCCSLIIVRHTMTSPIWWLHNLFSCHLTQPCSSDLCKISAGIATRLHSWQIQQQPITLPLRLSQVRSCSSMVLRLWRIIWTWAHMTLRIPICCHKKFSSPLSQVKSCCLIVQYHLCRLSAGIGARLWS